MKEPTGGGRREAEGGGEQGGAPSTEGEERGTGYAREGQRRETATYKVARTETE